MVHWTRHCPLQLHGNDEAPIITVRLRGFLRKPSPARSLIPRRCGAWSWRSRTRLWPRSPQLLWRQLGRQLTVKTLLTAGLMYITRPWRALLRSCLSHPNASGTLRGNWRQVLGKNNGPCLDGQFRQSGNSLERPRSRPLTRHRLIPTLEEESLRPRRGIEEDHLRLFVADVLEPMTDSTGHEHEIPRPATKVSSPARNSRLPEVRKKASFWPG
jgi:hypothetical protein